MFNLEERIVDLDALVLRCRDDRAKSYIAEAVACYRAGAFRACIVTTWVAVVYDILHKLDELAISGDKNAENKRVEFEEFRQRADIANSLKFERHILDIAKDEFELISPMEHEDLQRLIGDRNRCAHPSMNAYDEVYQPSAELARYHLRNAVTHLLQHQPIQGKSALERLLREVNSTYFPSSSQDALAYFQHGPLLRPREVLVRNFVIVLIKALLRENIDESRFGRYTSALNAVRSMHRVVVEKTFAQNLSDIVRTLPDDQFPKITDFLAHIPDVWQFISADIRNRVESFIMIMDISASISIFSWALEFEQLKSKAQQRINTLTDSEMTDLVAVKPNAYLVIRSLELYLNSQSYNHANKLAEGIILPLIPFLSIEHIDILLKIASSNGEVGGSFQFIDILKRIIDRKVLPKDYAENLIVNGCKLNNNIFLNMTDHLTFTHLDKLAATEISGWYFRQVLSALKGENKLTEEQVATLLTKRGLKIEEDDLPF